MSKVFQIIKKNVNSGILKNIYTIIGINSLRIQTYSYSNIYKNASDIFEIILKSIGKEPMSIVV